jgi:hypothetical protein
MTVVITNPDATKPPKERKRDRKKGKKDREKGKGKKGKKNEDKKRKKRAYLHMPLSMKLSWLNLLTTINQVSNPMLTRNSSLYFEGMITFA